MVLTMLFNRFRYHVPCEVFVVRPGTPPAHRGYHLRRGDTEAVRREQRHWLPQRGDLHLLPRELNARALHPLRDDLPLRLLPDYCPHPPDYQHCLILLGIHTY